MKSADIIQNNAYLCDLVDLGPVEFRLREVAFHHHVGKLDTGLLALPS